MLHLYIPNYVQCTRLVVVIKQHYLIHSSIFCSVILVAVPEVADNPGAGCVSSPSCPVVSSFVWLILNDICSPSKTSTSMISNPISKAR